MPVWRIQHDRMKIGTKVPGSNPPMWVAEVKHAPSIKDQVSDDYARRHNEVRPENFHVPRVPIRMRWWHRLVGSQQLLQGFEAV